MALPDGAEPITDDERLFRRISARAGWYDESMQPPLAWVAFRPNANDVQGLSVWRAKYMSPEEAARTAARVGHVYYVAVLRAGKLRGAGVEVLPSPQEGGLGHASLANITAAAYQADKDAIRNLAETIARIAEDVLGPFGPFNE